jgi:CheY-like chemotaxis protein
MSRRVLVVDDHEGFRAAARRLLEGLDYDVDEAVDGGSALAAATRTHPDLVLLDIVLPDVDGFTVARELAAAGVPCRILLTSSRDAADYAGPLSAPGAPPFVAKDDLSALVIEDLAW